jgi:hypothetical protein
VLINDYANARHFIGVRDVYRSNARKPGYLVARDTNERSDSIRGGASRLENLTPGGGTRRKVRQAFKPQAFEIVVPVTGVIAPKDALNLGKQRVLELFLVACSAGGALNFYR